MILTNFIKSYHIFTDEEVEKIRNSFVPIAFETNSFLLTKGEISDKVAKNTYFSGSCKILPIQGLPETTVSITQSALYPVDSDDIFDQLFYQDDYPLYFEGSPIKSGSYCRNNVKVALISN